MLFTLRRRVVLFLLLASLSILAGCSREKPESVPETRESVTGNSVSGKVIRIVDGDTITILDAQNVQHKIRLQGIDSPERNQAFYQVARKNLSALVYGKQVTVDYAKIDRWGRLVGKVSLDGNDECLEQIKAGLAWHFKRYENEQPSSDRRLYDGAEQEARALKRGLWQDPNPTPPWEYRHRTSGSTNQPDSEDTTAQDPTLNNAPPSGDRFRGTLPNSDSSNNSGRSDSFAHRGSSTDSSPPNANSGVAGAVRGNRRSHIYHWPGCADYENIAPHNRVPFGSREEAEQAGYRAARNCP